MIITTRRVICASLCLNWIKQTMALVVTRDKLRSMTRRNQRKSKSRLPFANHPDTSSIRTIAMNQKSDLNYSGWKMWWKTTNVAALQYWEVSTEISAFDVVFECFQPGVETYIKRSLFKRDSGFLLFRRDFNPPTKLRSPSDLHSFFCEHDRLYRRWPSILREHRSDASQSMHCQTLDTS